MVHIKVENKFSKNKRLLLCGKKKKRRAAVYDTVYAKFPNLFTYCKNCEKCLTKGDT